MRGGALHDDHHVAAASGKAPALPELQIALLVNETLVWQRGPAIGSGRFGTVYLALRVPSGEHLAVKRIYIQEELEQGNDVSSLSIQRVLSRQQIERETSILAELVHPNIVQYIGCECDGPTAHIFMEYIHAGSLSKLLKEFGPFHESTTRSYIHQTLCGVQYLHAMGIAHRDLKCANLLLADDGRIKIADFGTAKKKTAIGAPEDDDIAELQQQHALETARSVRDGLGSPYWMAPELVRAEKGDDAWQKADIWGIGCVMIEMTTGKPPWETHSNPLTAMFHIASDDAIPPFPESLSDLAKQFLSLCLVKNPKTRSSATELLQHPFLTTTVHTEPSGWPHPADGTDASTPSSTSRRSSAANDHATEEEAELFPDSNSSTYLEAPNSKIATPSARTLDDGDSVNAKAVPTQNAQGIIDGGVASSRSDEVVENGTIVDSREDSPQDVSDDEASSCASFSSDSGSPHSAASRSSLSSEDDNEPPTAYSSSSDEDNDERLSATGRFSAEEEKEDEPKFQVFGTVRAIADYASADPNELSMAEDDTLEVLEMRSSGWWRGRLQAKQRDDDTAITVGWFPWTYIEWVASSANTVVKKTHVADQDNELSVHEGDLVHVTASEWRNGSLWAHGSIASSDAHTHDSSTRVGWFPFESIMDA
uniref:Protein kinase domain-containing protein n=1 Tax=Globisporangium ultimum (strain ATCC 200006 / CBS 805.95 / DAOM BR144) TaxID=431595 RepID=K3WUD0_GLOUD